LVVRSKGFMRTLESVIAMLIAVGVLSWATNAVSGFSSFEAQRKGIDMLLDSLIDMGILGDYLESYDFRGVESLLYYTLPQGVRMKIELRKWTRIEVEELSGANVTKVLYFTYNFPEGTNPYSIKVLDGSYTLKTRANWVWYRVPITIHGNGSSLSNITVEIKNISIHADDPISDDSFVFYYKGTPVDVKVEWSGNQTDRVVNVTTLLPSLVGYEKAGAYLYYATNETLWSSTYANLASPISVDYDVGLWEEAPRADVLFEVSLTKNEEKTLYMEYGVNSEGGSYPQIDRGQINMSGVELTVWENELKGGKEPLFKEMPKEVEVSSRFVPTGKGVFRIDVYTWYP